MSQAKISLKWNDLYIKTGDFTAAAATSDEASSLDEESKLRNCTRKAICKLKLSFIPMQNNNQYNNNKNNNQ